MPKYTVPKLFKDGVLHTPGVIEVEKGQPVPQGAVLIEDAKPAVASPKNPVQEIDGKN